MAFVQAEGLVQYMSERAPELGWKRATIYRLAATGVLLPLRIGRRLWFDTRRIDEWLDAGGSALPGGWRKRPKEAV